MSRKNEIQNQIKMFEMRINNYSRAGLDSLCSDQITVWEERIASLKEELESI